MFRGRGEEEHMFMMAAATKGVCQERLAGVTPPVNSEITNPSGVANQKPLGPSSPSRAQDGRVVKGDDETISRGSLPNDQNVYPSMTYDQRRSSYTDLTPNQRSQVRRHDQSKYQRSVAVLRQEHRVEKTSTLKRRNARKEKELMCCGDVELNPGMVMAWLFNASQAKPEDVRRRLMVLCVLKGLKVHDRRYTIAELRAKLLAAGIEPNPGEGTDSPSTRSSPPSSSPSPVGHTLNVQRTDGTKWHGKDGRTKKEKKDQKTRQKAKHSSKNVDKAAAAVAEVIAKEMDQVMAAGDVSDEILRQSEEEYAAIMLMEKQTFSDDILNSMQKFMPAAVQWHACDPNVSAGIIYRVAENNLEPLFVPHVMYRAEQAQDDDGNWMVRRIEPVPQTQPDGKTKSTNEYILTPHDNEIGVPKGVYATIVYNVHRDTYGAFGVLQTTEDFKVELSVQEFHFLRSCRVMSRVLPDTLRLVMAKRTRVQSYLQFAYDQHRNTLMEDQLLSALLMVEEVGDHGVPDLLTHLTLQELSGQLNGSLVEGTYVRGYRMHLRDIFKEAFQTALSKVKAGSDPVLVKQELTGRLSNVRGGFLKLSDEVKKFVHKSADHCRMNATLNIRGLFPTFPEPSDLMNQLGGFMKRLNRPAPKMTPAFIDAMREMSDVLDTYVMKHSHEQLTSKDLAQIMIDKAAEHSEWTPNQREDYVRGSSDILAAIENGDAAVRAFLEHELKSFSTFVKSESYDPDALKSCRHITAPSHRLRGIMMCLLLPALERITEGTETHNVKHKTLNEIDESIVLMFSGITRAIMGSDYSSYESTMAAVAQAFEKRAFTRLSPRDMSFAVSVLFEILMSGKLTANCVLGYILLPIIRLSGTPHTSNGNLMGNIRFVLAALKLLQPSFNALEYLERGCFVAEGDDGVYRLPDGISVDDVVSTLKKEGDITLTSSSNFEAVDAEFCSAKLVIDESTAQVHIERIQDPLKLLSNCFALLSPDKNTNTHDHSLTLAKLASYLTIYPRLPVFSEVANTIIDQEEKTIAKLLDGRIKKQDSAVKAMFNRWASYRPEMVDNVKKRWSLFRNQSPSTALRNAVHHTFGYSPSEQDRMVAEFHEAYKKSGMKGALVCPLMESFWSARDAVKKMTVEDVTSFRSKISLAEASFRGASESIFTSTFLPRDIRESLSILLTILASGFAGTFTFLGIFVSFWYFLPLLEVVGGLLIVIPFVWLLCSIVLGLSFKTSRRITTTCAWGLILFSLYYWVKVMQRRAAAKRLLAETVVPVGPRKTSIHIPTPAETKTKFQKWGAWFGKR